MLKIGIIGLGPDWETRHGPALARLSQRIRVVAVYDAVAPRAMRVAQELRAVAAPGIRAVLGRKDVRAALVLGTDWQRLAPLRMGIAHGKPLYVAAPVAASLPDLDSLCREAAAQSLLIAPELRLRTAPATTRIQELAATHLGRANHITATMALPPGGDLLHTLVSAVDWCTLVIRSIPASIAVQPPSDRSLKLLLTFRRIGPNSAPVQAVLEIISRDEALPLIAEIECERGTIQLTGQAQLNWHAGDQTLSESLDSERTDVETLLDHFARRVVGGLVPVPGLDDVCRVMELIVPHRDRLMAALG